MSSIGSIIDDGLFDDEFTTKSLLNWSPEVAPLAVDALADDCRLSEASNVDLKRMMRRRSESVERSSHPRQICAIVISPSCLLLADPLSQSTIRITMKHVLYRERLAQLNFLLPM